MFEETLDSTIAGTKNLAIDSAQQGITALDSMEDNVEEDSTEGNLDSMQGLTLSTDNESESEQVRKHVQITFWVSFVSLNNSVIWSDSHDFIQLVFS